MESNIFERLNIDPGIIIIITLILTVILLVMVIMLSVRQSNLEQKYNRFMKGRSGKNLEDAFAGQLETIDKIKEESDLLHKRLSYVEKTIDRSFQKYGIVKYNAFREMSGNLSFALAILNDNNSGFVINCIHSNEGSYTYIKDIIKGECEMQLSEEESEAIKIASGEITARSTRSSSSEKAPKPETRQRQANNRTDREAKGAGSDKKKEQSPEAKERKKKTT